MNLQHIKLNRSNRQPSVTTTILSKPTKISIYKYNQKQTPCFHIIHDILTHSATASIIVKCENNPYSSVNSMDLIISKKISKISYYKQIKAQNANTSLSQKRNIPPGITHAKSKISMIMQFR